MKTALKLVENEAPEVADIYAAWRAEVAAIDWSRVHMNGDRRRPLDLPDTRKGWR